jgi:hypothetical protein
VSEGRKPPPLRARLHWYQLTVAEFALLTAMCEHCSDGSTVWASISRLSAYSKLSVRQIFNLIHGYTKPNGAHVDGLLQRGILSQLAKVNNRKHRPATYRINESAMVADPTVIGYLTKKQRENFLGIYRPPVAGGPVRPRQETAPEMRRTGEQQRTLKGLRPPATIAGGGGDSSGNHCHGDHVHLRQPLPPIH